MAIPRTSVRGFLRHAKSSLSTAIRKKEPVTLVIGNESADLDSIACSILYAYVTSMSPRSKSAAGLHIPVANIPRADIALRPELLALLPHVNIEADHIITLDDLPNAKTIEQVMPPESTKWVLVDHNALQGRLGAIYSNRVVGVIDHHDDEDKVPQDTGDQPRIITKSGSCCSLVANDIREAWDRFALGTASSGAAHAQGDSLLEDEGLASLWDAQAAQLALAAILIDTYDMTDENKVTEHDRRAVDYIVAKINQCPRVGKGFERSAFFNEIDEAKKDLDGLSLPDILRKDYKQWTESGVNIGISSVVKPLSFLQSKAGTGTAGSSYQRLISTAKDFAAERHLDILAIMTTSTSAAGDFTRELMTVSLSDAGETIVDRFASASGSELALRALEQGTEHSRPFRSWRQGNVACSRKQVAPMLRKAAVS